MILRVLLTFIIAVVSLTLPCPTHCTCYKDDELLTSDCKHQSIVDLPLLENENLEALDLSYNRIKEVKNNSFHSIPKLKYLSISNNILLKLEVEAFSGLTNLLELDLSNNYLGTINKNIFSSNPFLNSLSLRGNRLKSLPDSGPFLANLHSLKILNIASCKISKLPENSFKDMESLHEIDVSSNYLITLDIEVFSSLKQLENLNVSDNPLVCNCSLKRFWSVIKMQCNMCLNRLVCQEPLAYRGRQFMSVQHMMMCDSTLNATSSKGTSPLTTQASVKRENNIPLAGATRKSPTDLTRLETEPDGGHDDDEVKILARTKKPGKSSKERGLMIWTQLLIGLLVIIVVVLVIILVRNKQIKKKYRVRDRVSSGEIELLNMESNN